MAASEYGGDGIGRRRLKTGRTGAQDADSGGVGVLDQDSEEWGVVSGPLRRQGETQELRTEGFPRTAQERDGEDVKGRDRAANGGRGGRGCREADSWREHGPGTRARGGASRRPRESRGLGAGERDGGRGCRSEGVRESVIAAAERPGRPGERGAGSGEEGASDR